MDQKENDCRLSSKSDQPLREIETEDVAKISDSATVTKSEIERAKAEHGSVRKDGATSSEFSDPVYKKLAKLNGEINKMTKEELKYKLSKLRLDTKGVKEVLKRRLKNYYKKQKLMKARIRPPGWTKFDYLVVIDYEATCEKDKDDYVHEIIEFPAVLVDVVEMKIVDEFQSYCKPVINPQLTDFCVQLTGITQDSVDKAPEFSQVLEKFTEWMDSHQLGDGNSFAIVTDGPWDMSRFLHIQCGLSDIHFPRWARKWINLRKIYSNFYQCRRCGIEAMLISLGLELQGRLHCGLDDARNIARISIRLLNDGAAFKINEYLCGSAVEVSDRVGDVGCVTQTKPLPKEITSDDDLETGDNVKVQPQVKPQVKQQVKKKVKVKKTRQIDSELAAGLKSMTLVDGQEDGIDDLLEYYRLQSA